MRKERRLEMGNELGGGGSSSSASPRDGLGLAPCPEALPAEAVAVAEAAAVVELVRASSSPRGGAGAQGHRALVARESPCLFKYKRFARCERGGRGEPTSSKEGGGGFPVVRSLCSQTIGLGTTIDHTINCFFLRM